MSQIRELAHLKIPYQDIILATNNFAQDIGSGGFGMVYKGQLPHSNTTVAVKRLVKKHGQGQVQFLKELIALANICKQSNHLVSLVGFCDEGDERILVYKYECNGSLDKCLASTDLTWEQRLRICLGAARGLKHLHYDLGESHRVVHNDVKSGNILLDENWEAKISDFRLSKIGLMSQEMITLLATLASGTPGYIDPQQKNGTLSKESDVYSFGVVMFEVLCGRPAMIYKYDVNDERRVLYKFVKRRYEEGKIDEIIMPNLREQTNPDSLKAFSRIAYQCLNENRNQRPSMIRIIKELENIENQTGVPTELWGSSTGGSPWSLLLDDNLKLRKITIDHEDWIFSIDLTVEDLSGTLISSQHGGFNGRSGGELSEISVDADEEIIEIFGTFGVTPGPRYVLITSLCIVTNKRRHGPFGPETGTSFSFAWDVGAFAGFYGRAGFYLDGLGFYSTNKCSKENQNQRPWMICSIQEDQEPKSINHKNGLPTELWGSSTGGSPWSLLLDNNKKLRKMTIDHEDWIFSIGFTIEDSSGSLISSQYGGTRGGSGREFSEISFDADEEIIEISGTVGVTIKQAFTIEAISSLCIVTNKRRHGPFGHNTGNSFSVTWVVGVFAGFHGRADIYMDGLGFYSKKVI